MSNRNQNAVERGYCGHICEGGEFDTFVCTLEPEHGDDTVLVVHQSVQVQGELRGQISGAWLDDGTPIPGDVNLAPNLDFSNTFSPSQQARIEQRVKEISDTVVDRMVADYRQLPDTDATVASFCVALVYDYSTIAPQEALEQACEALSIAIRRLAHQ